MEFPLGSSYEYKYRNSGDWKSFTHPEGALYFYNEERASCSLLQYRVSEIKLYRGFSPMCTCTTPV